MALGSTSVLPDIYIGETTIVILTFKFRLSVSNDNSLALMVPTQFPSTVA